MHKGRSIDWQISPYIFTPMIFHNSNLQFGTSWTRFCWPRTLLRRLGELPSEILFCDGHFVDLGHQHSFLFSALSFPIQRYPFVMTLFHFFASWSCRLTHKDAPCNITSDCVRRRSKRVVLTSAEGALAMGRRLLPMTKPWPTVLGHVMGHYALYWWPFFVFRQSARESTSSHNLSLQISSIS